MWAILPLKQFDRAKQRLACILTPSQRRLLFEAMVDDVLAELAYVDTLDGILIVSADPRAGLLARKYGAELMTEPGDNTRGLNGAIDCGISHLLEHGSTGVMILHGDLPLIECRDIKRLVQIHRGRSADQRVTIVSDQAKQGSNCLLCTPPNIIPFAYGVGSYKKHLEEARTNEVCVQTVECEAPALDIDQPEGLIALANIMRANLHYQRRKTCLVLRDLGMLPPLAETLSQAKHQSEPLNEAC